jgi:hypothetical protein
MRRRSAFLLALAAVVFVLAPSPAGGDSATQTHLLVADAPNIEVAANGDTVEISCQARQHACGTFQAHPKALPDPPSGESVH